MREIELTAVFYVSIPDDADPDSVTLEVAEDGTLHFEADGEEIADHTDLDDFETIEVTYDDDEDDEDDDEEEEEEEEDR